LLLCQPHAWSLPQTRKVFTTWKSAHAVNAADACLGPPIQDFGNVFCGETILVANHMKFPSLSFQLLCQSSLMSKQLSIHIDVKSAFRLFAIAHLPFSKRHPSSLRTSLKILSCYMLLHATLNSPSFLAWSSTLFRGHVKLHIRPALQV
jgi:hypothetical protein